MKLPFISSIDNINTTRNYEPKSVLDDIRCSPNSSSLTADSSTDQFNSSLQAALYNGSMNLNNEQEWDNNNSDSLMRELGLYDDNQSNHDSLDLHLPDLPPFFYPEDQNIYQYPPPNFDNLLMTNFPDHELLHSHDQFDYRDELTRLAECVETQSFQHAHIILTRLNQVLRSPNGKPLQRTAFYFKQAFQSLLLTDRSLTSCTSYEIVQVIKAYKMFSSVSPIPLFASFTATQAILDAVDGAMIVHVIDFDIGFGGQWASFLKAVSEKAEARKVSSPAVRITAVVQEGYELESRLIRENLHQFCDDLKLGFEIDFVSIRAFELLSFKAVKFVNSGEKTAIVVTPTIFRRIGSGFVNDIRRVSPDVVVFVDGEVNVSGSSFFRQTVCDGLELYTTVIESLEAANGGGGDLVSSIEMFVLLPKIIAAVEDGARPNVPPWREVFGRVGMRPVGLSQFADFQAECLLRRVQVRGFHVVKRHAEMVLCWHDRPLVATSAWTC